MTCRCYSRPSSNLSSILKRKALAIRSAFGPWARRDRPGGRNRARTFRSRWPRLSSWTKWRPFTLTSVWFGQARQSSRCRPTRIDPGSALIKSDCRSFLDTEDPIQRSHRPACRATIKSTHFAVRPGPKISDGEAFEEGICLNDFFSLGSTRCVGGCHNEGGVGILRC